MPPSSTQSPGQGDDFALKSFMTRKRSLARRSVHGTPKSIFSLSTTSENSPNELLSPGPESTKSKRPVSIIAGFDSSPGSLTANGNPRSNVGRPISMISMSSGGQTSRNQFRIDLAMESGNSNVPHNVLRNTFSGVDKKIFNTPQMNYSPEISTGNPSYSLEPSISVNNNYTQHFSEKKYNLGGQKSSPGSEKQTDSDYNNNIRSIHRQFNINKFNVSLKNDLFKDVKSGKTDLLKQFEKIQETEFVNTKTPVVNRFSIKNGIEENEELMEVDWDFWKSVIDHYPSKMNSVSSLKKIETVFSQKGVPDSIRSLIYLYLTNSKTETLEKIYKENSTISFFSKENDLRLKICETFNTDLRCLKSNQDLFEINDLNKELLQKVDKDLFEILRNFTIYYDRGGYLEIKGLLSPNSSPSVNARGSPDEINEKSFYLPSKTIISICALLLRSSGVDKNVLNIKTNAAKLSNAEIFSLLIMLNENYFNFDNNINARNLSILRERKKSPQTVEKPQVNMSNNSFNTTSGASSRRSSITVESLSMMNKTSNQNNDTNDLNNIRESYLSDYNRDKFIYIFNRSLEDLFPEVFLYLSSKGIHTNILLERFIFEFFHRFSNNYKLFDTDNSDEKNIPKEDEEELEEVNEKSANSSTSSSPKSKKTVRINDIELNSTEFETIKASINNDLSLKSIGEINGDLEIESNNEFFKNGYKLTDKNLLRILDMVMIQGVEFLIKFLLLVIEKNYFKIFKIKNNQVLMKFLSSNVIFSFLKDEKFKFVNKFIKEDELHLYENINSYANTNPVIPEEDEQNSFKGTSSPNFDIKEIAKNTTIRSDLRNNNKTSRVIEITVKEKKIFGDFMIEALKFEPIIYKYEEELKVLEKERRSNLLGTGIYKHGNANNSFGSIATTITSNLGDDDYQTRNSSQSSISNKSYNSDDLTTPELIGLRSERKDNKVRLMKLQTDLNNLSLTHKSYKEEILHKNEKLNKIKNFNLELKLKKEELSRKLEDLKLKEELFHSVLRNCKIEKMNDDVKSQIEFVADDIRAIIEKTDKIKEQNEVIKNKYESSNKSSKSGSPAIKAAGSWFGFGR